MSLSHARAIPPEDARGEAADPPRAVRSISTGPPRTTPEREVELVEAHRNGDAEALAELLQSYQRRVYSVCYRMVRDPEQASDLAQDTLVKLIEGLDRYDGRSKLSTWVYRIAVNCCISHMRREKLRSHGSLDAVMERDDRAAGRGGDRPRNAIEPEQMRELSAAERIEQEELRARLNQAVEGLEPEMRAILVLRDMQGLEYGQLADVLDVPIGTVKSRLFRAREALREAMEDRSSAVGSEVGE